MARYRSFVEYHAKKGTEKQVLQFLEKELIEKADRYACHHVEIYQDEADSTWILGVAEWSSLEEAKQFQSQWEKKERELSKQLAKNPIRHFSRCCSCRLEKGKKAA